jgi:hypothetical protein
MLDGSNLASSCAAVTPNDTTVLGFKALYIGVAGDVTIINSAGSAVTFTAHANGYMPVSGLVVKSAGTTATNIVALF